MTPEMEQKVLASLYDRLWDAITYSPGGGKSSAFDQQTSFVQFSKGEALRGEAKDRDGRGRPLPKWQGCRVVGDGDLFLMNWQSDDSLDGRYFGFLPASSVIGRAMPVWTWEG